jgi:hypothetical protein
MSKFNHRRLPKRFNARDLENPLDGNLPCHLPRHANTDGSSASGGLAPGSFVENGMFWCPMPILGPVTKSITIDGKSVFLAWDDQKNCPVHTEGPLTVGQLLDGTTVKFLLPDRYKSPPWY